MGWGVEEENPGRVVLPPQSEPSGRMKKLTMCHLKWSSYRRWHWYKVSWYWKQTRMIPKGWTWAGFDLSVGCSYFDNILVKLSHQLKFCLKISCDKEQQTILFSQIVYTGIFLQWALSHQKQGSVTTIPKTPSVSGLDPKTNKHHLAQLFLKWPLSQIKERQAFYKLVLTTQALENCN